MNTKAVFPIGLFTTKAPSPDEEYCCGRVAFKYFCEGVKRHKQYICTALSSAPHNETDLNLSLGYTDLKVNGVRVIECSEYQISEKCKIQISYQPYQTEWVPSYSELLAVASDDICFYEYKNQNLILKESFLEVEDNPVICMDWDRCQPEEMLITRLNGEIAILSMEYGTPIEIIRNRQPPDQLLEFPRCGARFGTREMEHCIFLIEEDDDGKRIKVFDRQFLALHDILPRLSGQYLSVKCSNHSGYLIASLTPKKVYIHELRFFNKNTANFHDFEQGEYATCICWSSYAPELYIGTSTGTIVKWMIDDGKAERYFNQNKKIASIHCPKLNRDLLFSICYELPKDRYPNTIEVYSMQSFL